MELSTVKRIARLITISLLMIVSLGVSISIYGSFVAGKYILHSIAWLFPAFFLVDAVFLCFALYVAHDSIQFFLDILWDPTDIAQEYIDDHD